MMRLLELQKKQLENESNRMKTFMQDFMDNMVKMQDNNMSNVHGGAFDKGGNPQMQG